MEDQGMMKFKTIRKTDLLQRWVVARNVNIPADQVQHRNDDPLYIAQQAQVRMRAHGALRTIHSKRTLRSGKVMYSVEWTDGTQTQEGVRLLHEVDLGMLLDFHEKESDPGRHASNSNSSSGDEVYQPRRPRNQHRYTLVSDSSDENQRETDSEEASDTNSLALTDRSTTTTPSDDSSSQQDDRRQRNTKELKQQQQQSVQKKLELLVVPGRGRQGPMAAVPYYKDPVIVRQHDPHCLKCKGTGYPNGPPLRRKQSKRQIPDDEFELTPEEAEALQGRLLLCVTCTASTHEGCLAAPHKRFLRECIKDGEPTTEFQCALCLLGAVSSPECIPACDKCKQVHTLANLKLLPAAKARLPDATMTTTGPLPGETPMPDASDGKDADGTTSDPTNLFRCSVCRRAFHHACMPLFDTAIAASDAAAERAKMERKCMQEHKCATCITLDKKVDKVVTWRVEGEPADKRLQITLSDAAASPKEFLVKWEGTSYCHLTWVPEDWISRVAKQKYAKFCERVRTTMHATEEDVVPKAWKTVERILTAVDKHDNVVSKGPAGRVHRMLVKHYDLNYDEACWDTPPAQGSDLYSFFEDAYKRYMQACRVEPATNMRRRIEDVRYAATRESYSKHEIKQQPDFIAGGTLLPHQLEGLNWLIYQWERQSPCILADDMGLGKTIQIISFLNYLFKKFDVYPFLVIVPNSTATNWLREFTKWAPDMVVSSYYGSAKSRRLVREHELFRGGGGGGGGLRCHAVILTYESAAADTSVFAKTKFWPAVVVDEAQRLKNNESLLFQKLKSLRWDHTVLMTGTPLQNNIRELMNLMHFVDPVKFTDVVALEEKYEHLSREVVQELHDQLKPYFLRRTKDLVLQLPPKSEIIVPVTMTPLQKEVCKGLLEKNLMTYAILGNGDKANGNTKRSLNNILMQLRKALNHPYLISDIEMQQDSEETTHKVLIDASAKLKVLHQMLPKLLQEGHRILIFSTLSKTLDVLEDYLTYEGLKYVRLDGQTPTVDRVKSIDSFNKTGSDINIFLLTIRAGGVGINLATADTVIMWDFDPNPHLDQQAIARAHRFGQTSPVLVLKFMTRFSVEEKIAQMAKKKLVLDHLVVEKMDDDDLEENDIESIIKFGTQALFDDDESKDITYDSNAVDKLLDRSHIVAGAPKKDAEQDASPKGAFSFSFARVWNTDKEGATDEVTDDMDTQKEDDFWSKFLRQKKEQYEAEQKKVQELGRGARKRGHVSYREVGIREAKSDQPKKKRKGKDGVPEPNGQDDDSSSYGGTKDAESNSDSDSDSDSGSGMDSETSSPPVGTKRPKKGQTSSIVDHPSSEQPSSSYHRWSLRLDMPQQSTPPHTRPPMPQHLMQGRMRCDTTAAGWNQAQSGYRGSTLDQQQPRPPPPYGGTATEPSLYALRPPPFVSYPAASPGVPHPASNGARPPYQLPPLGRPHYMHPAYQSPGPPLPLPPLLPPQEQPPPPSYPHQASAPLPPPATQDLPDAYLMAAFDRLRKAQPPGGQQSSTALCTALQGQARELVENSLTGKYGPRSQQSIAELMGLFRPHPPPPSPYAVPSAFAPSSMPPPPPAAAQQPQPPPPSASQPRSPSPNALIDTPRMTASQSPFNGQMHHHQDAATARLTHPPPMAATVAAQLSIRPIGPPATATTAPLTLPPIMPAMTATTEQPMPAAPPAAPPAAAASQHPNPSNTPSTQ